MWSSLVAVTPPILQFLTAVVECQQPVRVGALYAQAAVERLNEGVVCWLAGPAQVERDVVMIGAQIEVARDEL